MANPDTQLLVIGAGPGGYAAAFLAADQGLTVTLVDKNPTLGGVCLNRGCIPSKALLHAAKLITDANEAKDIGIEFTPPQINIAKLREWKNGITSKLTTGLAMLAKQRKVTFLQGAATFINSNTVKIKHPDGAETELPFNHAILASGSEPMTLPFTTDCERVMNSSAALQLNDDVVVEAAETIYEGFRMAGIDTVIDDRNERAGFKFKDADLIGYPVQVVLGGRSVAAGNAEVKFRGSGEKTEIPLDDVVVTVRDWVLERRRGES